MKKYAFSLATFLLITFSCKPTKTKDSGSETTPTDQLPAISISCASAGESTEGIPSFRLTAIEGDQVFLLDNLPACQMIPKSDFPKYQIPAEAHMAAGGWYAGGGDYFYTLRENDQWLIKKGGIDEMQLTQSYGYRTVAVYKNGAFTKVEGEESLQDQILGLYSLGGHHESWLVLIDQGDQGQLTAQMAVVDGMLPPAEDLAQQFEDFQFQPFFKFDFDEKTQTFTSDKGNGLYDKTNTTISFFEQKSHISDTLTLTLIQK